MEWVYVPASIYLLLSSTLQFTRSPSWTSLALVLHFSSLPSAFSRSTLLYLDSRNSSFCCRLLFALLLTTTAPQLRTCSNMASPTCQAYLDFTTAVILLAKGRSPCYIDVTDFAPAPNEIKTSYKMYNRMVLIQSAFEQMSKVCLPQPQAYKVSGC